MVKKSVKSQIIKTIVLFILFLVILIVIYLVLDADMSKVKFIGVQQNKMSTSYKEKFWELSGAVEKGYATGIPNLDDAGIVIGDMVEITPGKGDFVDSPQDTSYKSFLGYNSYQVTYPRKSTGSFLVNKHFLKDCVVYNNSGITKYKDKYILVAVGTYWGEKFNLEETRGSLFRVGLEGGKTYDVMFVDVKSETDNEPNSVSICSPSGRSFGHKKEGGALCMTEFYRINFNRSYPVRQARGSNPAVNYQDSVSQFKDPDYPISQDIASRNAGNFNYSEPFKGNVISFTKISDPDTEAMVKDARSKFNA